MLSRDPELREYIQRISTHFVSLLWKQTSQQVVGLSIDKRGGLRVFVHTLLENTTKLAIQSNFQSRIASCFVIDLVLHCCAFWRLDENLNRTTFSTNQKRLLIPRMRLRNFPRVAQKF